MRIKLLLTYFILAFVFFLNNALAAKIVLKSGQVIEAEVLERTDRYIKVDFFGAQLTYYYSDIESIDGIKITEGAVKATAEAAPGADTPQKEKRNFIWEVKSGTNTVYMLGSIHVARPDMYPLSEVIEDAFNKSDILVLEVDMEKNSEEIKRQFAERALYPEGQGLKADIPDDLYRLLQMQLSQLSIPISAVERWRPWYVCLMLEQYVMQKLGYYPAFGIDNYFMRKARGKKYIYGLETPEFQLDLLSKMDKEQEQLRLYYTIMSMGMTQKEGQKLRDTWKNGDTKELEFMVITSSLLQDPRLQVLFEKIFDQRNITMSAKIEEYLKTPGTTYFVIVGAGHLIGKKGIVELLKSRGYSVRQL